jgi:hypothetical protein
MEHGFGGLNGLKRMRKTFYNVDPFKSVAHPPQVRVPFIVIVMKED